MSGLQQRTQRCRDKQPSVSNTNPPRLVSPSHGRLIDRLIGLLVVYIPGNDASDELSREIFHLSLPLSHRSLSDFSLAVTKVLLLIAYAAHG